MQVRGDVSAELRELWERLQGLEQGGDDIRELLETERTIYDVVLRAVGAGFSFGELERRVGGLVSEINSVLGEARRVADYAREHGLEELAESIEESPERMFLFKLVHPSNYSMFVLRERVSEEYLDKYLRGIEEELGIRIPREIRGTLRLSVTPTYGAYLYGVRTTYGMPLSYIMYPLVMLYIYRNQAKIREAIAKLRKLIDTVMDKAATYEVVEEKPRRIVLRNRRTGNRVTIKWSYSHGTQYTSYTPFLGATKEEKATIRITGKDHRDIDKIADKIYRALRKEGYEDAVKINTQRGTTIRFTINPFSYAWSNKKTAQEERRKYDNTIRKILEDAIEKI